MTDVEKRGATEIPPGYDHAKYIGHPSNQDLKLFNEAEAWSHYQDYGRREGRVCSAIDGRAAFLRLVSPDRSLLEIGPSCAPAFRRPSHQVWYLDAFSTDELKDLTRSMLWGDPALVPDIDFVWKGRPYCDLMGREFDTVFSSHNVEHQPCLVTHLLDVESILRQDGRLLLVVPDKRFCFDYFLSESTIAEVLDAFLTGRKKHSVKSLLQGRLLHAHNDASRHWLGDHGDDPRWRTVDRGLIDGVRHVDVQYRSGTGYLDAHAWQFTPATFRYIIQALEHVELVSLHVEQVYETMYGSNEFFAVLSRKPIKLGAIAGSPRPQLDKA